jgi:mono/diheme cytochrome c family protein
VHRIKSLLLVAAVTVPAAAFTFGGWAITTVEDVPEYAVAGKPFDITYTVRQHGQSIMTNLSGKVSASSGLTTKNADATSLGEGVYRARLTIPKAGDWDVEIETGFMGSKGAMLPLKVIAANASVPAPMSAFDRGHQLYVAKGCASCHSHQLTKSFNRMNMGPDLTEPKFASAYLERFLANPSIKKDWKNGFPMPNIGLKPAEVTALVAFLNQEKR